MKRTLALILLMSTLLGRIPPVLRLHVVANSDSDVDQNVKLMVRDAVTAYLEDKMLDMENLEEVEAYVQAEMGNLVNVANAVLQNNGMAYKSSASLCVDTFPEKTYGDVVFPAGDYHALRIVLGEGKGHNWWCVLFPPLCLIDAKQTDPDWQPEDGVTYKSWLLTLFQ